MNNQIEEMAEYFCHTCDFECGGGCELGHKIVECPIATETAKTLYNAGYRKQEDVAREIFAEIYYVIDETGYFDEIDFKELKKKYGVMEE